MIKKILVGIAVVLGVIVLGGLVLPDAYQVSRNIKIIAAPQAVHPYLENLMLWKEWAPWEKADPTIVSTIGADTVGVGASQSWTDKNGGGRLELTLSELGRVEYDVYFAGSEKPHHTVMTAVMHESGTSVVTWTMTGEMDMLVIGPYFKLFADKMMGPMFQDGLVGLKKAVEAY